MNNSTTNTLADSDFSNTPQPPRYTECCKITPVTHRALDDTCSSDNGTITANPCSVINKSTGIEGDFLKKKKIPSKCTLPSYDECCNLDNHCDEIFVRFEYEDKLVRNELNCTNSSSSSANILQQPSNNSMSSINIHRQRYAFNYMQTVMQYLIIMVFMFSLLVLCLSLIMILLGFELNGVRAHNTPIKMFLVGTAGFFCSTVLLKITKNKTFREVDL